MLHCRVVARMGAAWGIALAATLGAWAALGSVATHVYLHPQRGQGGYAWLRRLLLAPPGAIVAAFAYVGWSHRDTWSAADREMSVFPAWWVQSIDALFNALLAVPIVLVALITILVAFGIPVAIASFLPTSGSTKRVSDAISISTFVYAALATAILLGHDWLSGASISNAQLAQIVLAKRGGALLGTASVALSLAALGAGRR